ncbi:MAG: DUF3306 domain-containing protein [Rhodovibrionaceae bacterium]|nr:DUF3306 domain-containing protein [Rhodovibrionaceae bacterium]
MAKDDKQRPRKTKADEAEPGSESGFLGRWARRKQESRSQESEREAKGAPPAAESRGEVPERSAKGDEVIDPETLPDPDELPADADWTVFMRQGVPEALQRRALRRLWRLNPVFGHLDRLNDYDDDYTDAATVVQGLKTLYKVGKGMVTDDAEKEQEQQPGPDEQPAGQETADKSVEAEAPSTDEAQEQPQPQRSETPQPRSGTAGRRKSGKPTGPAAKSEPPPSKTTGQRARRSAEQSPPANAAARRWNRFST